MEADLLERLRLGSERGERKSEAECSRAGSHDVPHRSIEQANCQGHSPRLRRLPIAQSRRGSLPGPISRGFVLVLAPLATRSATKGPWELTPAILLPRLIAWIRPLT